MLIRFAFVVDLDKLRLCTLNQSRLGLMSAAGRPRFVECGLTVSHILEMFAGGMTAEEILKDFPYLEKPDIEACLERQAAHREVVLSK